MDQWPNDSLTQASSEGNLRGGMLWSSLVCVAITLLFLAIRLPEVAPPIPLWVVGLLEEGGPTGEATRGEDVAHRMLPDETGLPLQSLRGPLAPEGLLGKRKTLEGVPQAPPAAPPTGREGTPSRSWRPYVSEMAAGAETGQEVDWYSVEGPLQYRPILASPAPTYPAGVQVERRVRVHVMVSPSGGVVDAFAVERGHAALDSAAVASLYRWRFAPLPENADQVNQEGDVTFLFQLKAPGAMR